MRRTRIASVALRQPPDVPDEERVGTNLDSVLGALETVERHDPDLVVFPEVTLQHGCSCPAADLARPVPGPETDAVRERARAMDAHVVLPMNVSRGGYVTNSAVIIDDDGGIKGAYDKLRPTAGELDDGKLPGSDTPVWETPFGRLGAAICFDLHYQEIAMGLAGERADVVAFPSMMAGDEMLRAWAINHGFFVVQCTADEAAVYTPGGDRVAANDDRNVGMVTDLDTGAAARIGLAEINTDAEQIHLGALRSVYEELMDEYGDGLAVDKCSTEAYAVLESTGDVPLSEILDEFDLETKQAYLERVREAAAEARPESALGGRRSRPSGPESET